VCGVGNAIVDMIATESDAFLAQQAIAKGGMTLIEADRADALTKALPGAQQASGGSGANSIAGVASLGGKAAYIGKTADDVLGEAFRRDIKKLGVEYRTPPHKGGPATARCIIVVTPDAQRSMSTFLGCSPLMDKTDLDRELIENSAITFLEGYLFDREEAKAAFVQASEYAKAAGRKVALTLSDTFCVDRHRDSFRHLVDNHVDILFSNEAELKSLYETDDFDKALATVKGRAPIACVTRSEKGSVILEGDTVINVAPFPTKVVDTTGAGDLYAAGVLYGIAKGKPLEIAGRLGSLAAAEAISHFGARPQTSLADLARADGLL
jgi:sugar/nucleoside kinase (ribokinase family)